MYTSKYKGDENAMYAGIDEMMRLYTMGRKPIMRLAQESNSLFKVGSWYRIDKKQFDAHFRQKCKV